MKFIKEFGKSLLSLFLLLVLVVSIGQLSNSANYPFFQGPYDSTFEGYRAGIAGYVFHHLLYPYVANYTIFTIMAAAGLFLILRFLWSSKLVKNLFLLIFIVLQGLCLISFVNQITNDKAEDVFDNKSFGPWVFGVSGYNKYRIEKGHKYLNHVTNDELSLDEKVYLCEILEDKYGFLKSDFFYSDSLTGINNPFRFWIKGDKEAGPRGSGWEPIVSLEDFKKTVVAEKLECKKISLNGFHQKI